MIILNIFEKCKDFIKLNFKVIGDIWKYFIFKMIDILKTENINNKIIIKDDEFHKIGCKSIV